MVNRWKWASDVPLCGRYDVSFVSSPDRHPVSSSVSRAAHSSGVSPGSTRPAGTSQPHVSLMKRWRHSSSTPRRDRRRPCRRHRTASAGRDARSACRSAARRRRATGSSTRSRRPIARRARSTPSFGAYRHVGAGRWKMRRRGDRRDVVGERPERDRTVASSQPAMAARAAESMYSSIRLMRSPRTVTTRHAGTSISLPFGAVPRRTCCSTKPVSVACRLTSS